MCLCMYDVDIADMQFTLNYIWILLFVVRRMMHLNLCLCGGMLLYVI
jgi:hypothetical protein